MSQTTTADAAGPRVADAPNRKHITRRALRPILMLGGILAGTGIG